jgi:hypothetical protein
MTPSLLGNTTSNYSPPVRRDPPTYGNSSSPPASKTGHLRSRHLPTPHAHCLQRPQATGLETLETLQEEILGSTTTQEEQSQLLPLNKLALTWQQSSEQIAAAALVELSQRPPSKKVTFHAKDSYRIFSEDIPPNSYSIYANQPPPPLYYYYAYVLKAGYWHAYPVFFTKQTPRNSPS